MCVCVCVPCRAQNVRLRDWQLATVINPALEHYTSLVARQDLFDAAVVDARASAGSPGGADMRDAVQRELAAENARLVRRAAAVGYCVCVCVCVCVRVCVCVCVC